MTFKLDDIKTLLILLPIIILLIKKIINIIGILEVEKIFMQKDSVLISNMKDYLTLGAIFFVISAYVSLILKEYNFYHNSFVKDKLLILILYISVRVFLFSAFFYLFRSYVESNKKAYEILIKHDILKKLYRLINVILLIYWLLIMAFLFSGAINKYLFTGIKLDQLFISYAIVVTIPWGAYKYYIEMEKLYRKSKFKFIIVKLKNNETFKNLYLQSQNEKYFFLGYNDDSKHPLVKDHLVINKDCIDYFYVVREDYYWGNLLHTLNMQNYVETKRQFILKK